ncbi:hypothetical protein RDWZM_002242 [Blomia tropicalis]|uniref:Uncharacterized protein n=1 Tax=Blomia tropicalis TaxID=40697 RepID=A0A9Q0MG13_BLOTA|nr:hypothetical protein BLOT_002077 [Blomia tropicalis]KAJ6223697.1 hypothetical protein RDWZM_002242 [Blomia tropicalis]
MFSNLLNQVSKYRITFLLLLCLHQVTPTYALDSGFVIFRVVVIIVGFLIILFVLYAIRRYIAMRRATVMVRTRPFIVTNPGVAAVSSATIIRQIDLQHQNPASFAYHNQAYYPAAAEHQHQQQIQSNSQPPPPPPIGFNVPPPPPYSESATYANVENIRPNHPLSIGDNYNQSYPKI